MDILQVPGSVCAPFGFQAAGVHCGLAKKANKKDLGLIFSSKPCTAAAVYTKNKVQASPILVTKHNLRDRTAQAVIVNSGNANACNADGVAVAQGMCAAAAQALGILPCNVIVASTGVIGQPLRLGLIQTAMKGLAESLSAEGGADCMQAIMTTDLQRKEIAVSFTLGETPCKIGAIAKGSGMIHPNMGTMLGFITTDAAISGEMLQEALGMVCDETFNMVSVDGDTSTNDMACIMANGLAGNPVIDAPGALFNSFVQALRYVCIYLARMIAKDGEGATKLLECYVTGAKNDTAARILAKSVIGSSLVKAAMFGEDANWGRILCALGYAETECDPTRAHITLRSPGGSVEVCKNGSSVAFSEDTAKRVLKESEIEILVALDEGDGTAVAWGCDLTYDYVKINGDYRS